MTEAALKTVTRILREREIPFDLELLKTALIDAKSQSKIQEWVDEYLSPETLLTKDELRHFTDLTETGEFERLSKEDLSLVLDLNEYELRTAIEELRESTAAVERQNEVLRLQQNALSALCKTERRARQSRSQINRGQVRRWEAEKSSIAAAISELVQILIYKNSDLAHFLKTSDLNFKQAIGSILQSDDRLLSSFQKLASDLDLNTPEDENIIEKTKEYCARYIKYTVEGMRTKLDRIYLEALKNSSCNKNSEDNNQEVSDLQEELESLYSEIQPVAQIFVEKQYIEPVLQITKYTNSHSEKRLFKAFEYIENILSSITRRIELYAEKAKEFQGHRMAVEAVLKIARNELSYQDPPAPDTKLRRCSARDMCSLSSHIDGEIRPEEQLAQSLGITLPKKDELEEASQLTMEKTLNERIARHKSQESTLQSTIESFISSHLADARVTLVLLRDVLLDKSNYNKIQLVDPELLQALDQVEADFSHARQRLETLDLSDLESENSQRDLFVKHWSKEHDSVI
ncbi:hypothetical protein GcM3_092024 [Golovinomyces cichoracearum]|uniref:Uncharacterized protein n=1 Tax=Golovinomyces cichoracearum TaxID=62708 RepID=A0A420IH40_9PEZI|nr:hypothetical protein GcM3_092024 [Golovinomyces cichoracearum]